MTPSVHSNLDRVGLGDVGGPVGTNQDLDGTVLKRTKSSTWNLTTWNSTSSFRLRSRLTY